MEGAEGEALRGIARRARAGIMAGGDGAGDQIAGAEGAVLGSEVEGEDDKSLDEEGGGAVGVGGDGEGEDEEEDDQVSFAGFVG